MVDRSTDPVLHLLAGPDGAGRTTFAERVLQPQTHLPFVNADVIAARHWPETALGHAYDASRLAADERDDLMARGSSFISETVFSHRSKVGLVRAAVGAGYQVHLHVILVPEQISVHRVAHRVRHGGHQVLEAKIRERYRRLWSLVVEARSIAERTRFYDNTQARRPYRVVASYDDGQLSGKATWPSWTPPEVR